MDDLRAALMVAFSWFSWLKCFIWLFEAQQFPNGFLGWNWFIWLFKIQAFSNGFSVAAFMWLGWFQGLGA
ncbi:MAG: hypothetical protein KA138_01525 [Saprospiraceae bacterium]|jgi:hypothetical protein|nr:hypothetical protein [Saprospiraceae bacterium]